MSNGFTVYAACMFAGKTDALIIHIENLEEYGSLNAAAFYPKLDTRARMGTLSSHTGKTYPAQPVGSAGEILGRLEDLPDYDVIGIDEAQFFSVNDDPDLLEVSRRLLESGKRVIVAGLDFDFKARPFGLMPAMIAAAFAWGGDVYHLKAVCDVCGSDATMTQRLIKKDGDWVPAHVEDPVVLPGGMEEGYRARCVRHHKVQRD